MAFGNIAVGGTDTKTLTIRNIGNSDLAITGITYPMGYTGDSSTGTIVAGASKVVMVTFSPIAVEQYDGRIEVASDKTSGTNILAISGAGKAYPALIAVAGGTFTMGTSEGDNDEGPPHSVTLSDYSIGKTEVTVAQYRLYTTETGASMPTAPSWGWNDNDPILSMDWYEANAYCTWLSIKLGKTITLPTEAQWEFAAKGGTQSNDYTYSGSNDLGTVAWYNVNSEDKTHEVAQKTANELGLYDMSGNVWELCSDWYDSSYYTNSPSNNPQGPASGGSSASASKIKRGGSYYEEASRFILTDRASDSHNFGTGNTGFRVASSNIKIIVLSEDIAFGDVGVGEAPTKILTISNTGNSILTINSITYPAGYIGDWSTGTIAVNALQEVTVTFRPITAEQEYGGDIEVFSDKTDGTNTLDISGTGKEVTKIISLSEDMVFGDIPVGQTATETFTISNTGNSDLTINSITYPTGYTGESSTGNTIKPNALKVVTVTFSPIDEQEYNGDITVNSDKIIGTNILTISGTGVAETRVIELSVSGGMAFGNIIVGETPTKILTIRNTGNSDLNITDIDYPTGYTGNWSGAIEADALQEVIVTFSPTTSRQYNGNIMVNSDKTSGTNTLAISGAGKAYPTLIAVAGGTFTMGSSEGSTDERPTHSVTLSDYSIGRTEVTVAQYRLYTTETAGVSMPEEPRRGWNDNDPIITVSWHDAKAYCVWLSGKLDKTITLPTEAQWEFAARGGTQSNGYTYSGSNDLGTVGWYKGNSSSKIHEVAQKKANELGLYDMSGNLWEWCLDWSDSSYYSNSPSNNPEGPSSGGSRVIRSGAWNADASDCRVANRDSNFPSSRSLLYGFRVVSN